MSRIGTSSGPFFVGYETETTENEGSETIQVWQGTEVEVRSKRNLLVAQGANKVRISAGPGGDWQVRASFPTDDSDPNDKPVDVMELDTNVMMSSVYQSPIFRKRFSDYSATTGGSFRAATVLGVIEDCARKYRAGMSGADLTYNATTYETAEEAIMAELNDRLARIVFITSNGTISTGSSLNPAELKAARQLFVNIAFRQVLSFVEYNQVFRRTVTAGTPLAVKANFEGAGKIWTTAEVVSWEKIPADGWFTLPADKQWHKDKPSVMKTYGQKTQLTYHYTEVVTASALLYEKYRDAVLIDLP
jgi:hypothetical protein